MNTTPQDWTATLAAVKALNDTISGIERKLAQIKAGANLPPTDFAEMFGWAKKQHEA